MHNSGHHSHLMMQSESSGSSTPVQPMLSGLPMGATPSFSYNVMHSGAGFSSAQTPSSSTVTEQGHSAGANSASASGPPRLPPPPSPSSHPGSFVPGAVVQVMAPPGPLVSGVPDMHTARAGNYSFNGTVQPKQMDQSLRSDVRADGTLELRAPAPSQSFTMSASPSAHPNSSPSVTHFASNNFSSSTAWMPSRSAFQVPMGMANTPLAPAPPGTASSMLLPSSVDFSAFQRTSTAAAPAPSTSTSQHQAVAPYPTPSPQAASPGPWMQPQMSGFARPPLSPYPAVMPGPYPVETRSMPPASVSPPDVQPPGVPPPVSSVRASTSSFAPGTQLTVGSLQQELPPGIENSKHVTGTETKDETSNRDLDSWTAHRTEAGIVYYYNALTGESTYEKPSGFKGESDKAILQPSPISWEKLAGTDWAIVTTNDGKRYYYNTTTQVSSWQIPSEVTEFRKKQEADALKAQSVPVTNTTIVTEKGSAPASLNTPAANTGGRDATALRPSNVSGSSSALDLIKKKLQDSGMPATSPGPALSGTMDLESNGSKPIEAAVKSSENSKDKRKDANADADMSDSSSDSEDEEKGPTKEACILQFKEMLKERGVAPFSKWEKELPKIVFDPRFKAIPSHSARRALFEHYVRTRAEEERKEKRAAQRAALEGFKQLLEEAKEDINHNTDYQTFKMKWGDDPRFRALDRKERESLLNERVFPLKRAAQERAQAERAAAISDFKSMLQDAGDITSSSRWSKVKDSLKSDPRYKSVKHEDREKLFNEYVAELKSAEEERTRRAKAKQDEEEKLKERERALRKRKEREEQEVERVRLKARRKEAVESYQALLVETIKDPQASWTESKPKLEKDPQGRAANPHLDKADLEKFFREHVKSLHERCVLEFRALLEEVITAEAAAQETQDGKTVINSWSTAKQLLKSDPRYNKMPRKERESLWRRHAEGIQRVQKTIMPNQEEEKHTEGKSKSSVDSGRHVSGSRRTHDRR